MLIRSGFIKKIIIGFVVFFLTVFAILLLIARLSRPGWRTIKNPTKLIEECNSLLTDEPDLILDVNDWPESVKNLYPRLVFASQDYVDIIISRGGINYIQTGYLVYPDKRTKPDVSNGLIIRGVVIPGIFKYEIDINDH